MSRHYKLAAALGVFSLTWFAGVAPASAAEPAGEAVRVRFDQEFVVRDGVFETVAKGAAATLNTERALSPGWYGVKAQYRTPGLRDGVSLQVGPTDGKSAWGASEPLQATEEWTPLLVYFQVLDAQPAQIRFSSSSADSAGKLQLKDCSVIPVDVGRQSNLIPNGDFHAGKLGGLPAQWRRQYTGTDADYTLVADRSFRTGDRVLQIRSGDTNKRTVISSPLPLTPGSPMTLTFWARSQDEGAAITLRMYTPDWKWGRDDSFVLSTAWQKYTLTSTLPKSAVPFVIGRIDTAAGVTVQVAAAEASIANSTAAGSIDMTDPLQYLDSEWLGVPGKNMLVNPGFDLKGSGWTMDFFHPTKVENAIQMGTCEPSRIAPGEGMNGSDALYLPPGPDVLSYCSPLKVGQTYTLSAYVKPLGGEGDVWLGCLEPAWGMYIDTRKGLPADQWTRVSMTFKFEHRSTQKKMYTRFHAVNRPLLMDNIQLEVGELSAYEAPPLAVGLVAPDGDDSIFVRGKDKASLKLRAIPAGLAAARIEMIATDTWGRQVWASTADMNGTRIDQPIDLPTDKLGVFRVLLRATSPDGKVVGLGKSCYAIIEPPASEPAGEPRYFGWGLEVMQYPLWALDRLGQWGGLLGVRSNRIFMHSPEPGDVLQPEYAEIVRRQLAAFGKVDQTTIACFDPMPNSLLNQAKETSRPSPELLAAYRKNLVHYVNHFKNEVEYWELMNEVNIWRYRSGPRIGQRSMDAEKYMDFLKATSEALREGDLKVKVAAPALNTMDYDYVKRMLELGAANMMDAFTVHPYRSSPDMPSVYDDLVRLRTQLDQAGFTGPLIDDEQYFAANVYEMHNTDDEAQRGYFVPGREQSRAAGRIVRHYVHHIAAGIPFLLLAPQANLIKPDPDRDGYLHDGFAAYNAATRFLAAAGRGKSLPLPGEMRAFVFPDAAGGPLMVMYSVRAGSAGHIKLPGEYQAYDMMGNLIPQDEVMSGLRLATDPVYVRYAANTTVDQIAAAFRSAEVLGMGEPMDAEARIGGPGQLVLDIRNRQLAPLSGTAELEQVPEGWTALTPKAKFKDIPSGQSVPIAFKFGQMPVKNLGTYTIGYKAVAGEAFVRSSANIRPFFSMPAQGIVIDADLSDWAKADWAALGEESLSKHFGTDPHTGPQDLSARVASSWKSDGIYLAIEVTDDTEVWPQGAGRMYTDDCIQVYFDQLNNALPGNPVASRQDEDIAYSLGLVDNKAVAYLNKNPEGRYIGEANQSTGIDTDVQLAIRREGKRTIYEAFFPQSVLPHTTIEAGRSIGFAFLINDNDGKERKTGLTVSPKGTEPHGQPDMYVDLVLLAPAQ